MSMSLAQKLAADSIAAGATFRMCWRKSARRIPS